MCSRRYRGRMAKVLVTGMSGTGKSACLEILTVRGFNTIDTDTDEWSVWATDPDGTSDWIWREVAIDALLDKHEGGQLFVAGCKTNQGKFYARFDHIVLLSAPAEIILERVTHRSINPYGKTDEQRQQILRYLSEVEPQLRATATIEIDSSSPIIDVVDHLQSLA